MSDYTLQELLAAARERFIRVKPEELQREANSGAIVVDVRDSAQIEEFGELPRAHRIDLTVLEWRLAPSSEFKTIDVADGQRVVLVCMDGYSSSLAAARLQDLGVSGATDLEGGYRAWKRWTEAV